MNKIFHFQKFKIMQLVIEKKFSALKAALFSASDFSKQKILVGSEIYLKKSTKWAQSHFCSSNRLVLRPKNVERVRFSGVRTKMIGLSCDSSHALEMIDDALELTRAWNGMFVCFVRGYNVGPMNLNWAFVLEIESNPDFFAILNWQIWLTQVTCGKLGHGEKISI